MSGETHPKWQIEGEYFESCNCDSLCPCLYSRYSARPTHGHCDTLMAFQVQGGHYGELPLKGRTVLIALTTPGPMGAGNWTFGLYLDDGSTPAEQAALDAIFSGRAGGAPMMMAALTSTRLPTRVVPLRFESDGERRSVHMPGLGEASMEGIVLTDAPACADNVVHVVASRLNVGITRHAEFADQGLHFSQSNSNALYAPFRWAGGDGR